MRKFATRIRLYSTGFLFSWLLVSAGSAAAAGLEPQCKDLEILMSKARQQLARNGEESGGSAGSLPLGADSCATALGETGSRIYYCNWGFPFRAGKARQLFEDLDAQITDCLENRPEASQDLPVNHPDFYLLRTYHLNDVEISISVKDKSALQKSLVFIRFRPPHPPE